MKGDWKCGCGEHNPRHNTHCVRCGRTPGGTKLPPIEVKDQTYCLRQGEHYALVNGEVFGPWPDAGTARAGMQTEQRRALRRKESR